MSVVVLYKDRGKYKIAGDGRVIENDAIITDQSPKVYKTTDENCIYGIVGNCADILLLQDAIETTHYHPKTMFFELNDDKLLRHFVSCAALFVNSKGYCYLIESTLISKNREKHLQMAFVAIEDRELPYFIGSGSTELRPIFGTLESYSNKNVDKAFRLAYKFNSTIGGAITRKELETFKDET